MRKRTRVILAVVIGLILFVLLGLFALYQATQHVPEEYRSALRADPIAQRKGSDELLRQAGALAGDLNKEGRWGVLFTADQINGWLAVDMVENHPNLLSEDFSDPRVVIFADRVTLFGRLHRDGKQSVVSLTVTPYLAEENEVAVRIRDARAGLVPLPLGEVLDAIKVFAGNSGFPVHWAQTDGDPVALIKAPLVSDDERKTITIDTLRLGDGEIFVGGTTK